jgi:hypothetical protein
LTSAICKRRLGNRKIGLSFIGIEFDKHFAGANELPFAKFNSRHPIGYFRGDIDRFVRLRRAERFDGGFERRFTNFRSNHSCGRSSACSTARSKAAAVFRRLAVRRFTHSARSRLGSLCIG